MRRDDVKPDPALSRALERLGTTAVPVEDTADLERRRARLLPGLTDVAARELERRDRARRWLLPAAIAAAVAAAAAVFALTMVRPGGDGRGASGAAVLSGDGVVKVGGDGAMVDRVGDSPLALKDHDRVETLEGHAEVRLVSGAFVELDPRTRLDLLAAAYTAGSVDERVSLPSGSIRVRVPKLGAQGRLVVATPNASVTVHGTAFTVDVHAAPTGGVETRVGVSEGLVSVQSGGREVFLAPGASWSSSAAAARPTQPEASGAVGATAEPATPSGATDVPEAAAGRPASSGVVDVPPPGSAGAKGAPAVRRSTLPDENALFRRALASRRDGRPAETLELVATLLARYPGTPLAAEARAEADRARADLARAKAP